MEQKNKRTRPSGINLNIWHIIGFMLLGGWFLDVKLWAVLVFWGGYLLMFLAAIAIRVSGGPNVLALRASWIIHRARQVKIARKRIKEETDILKAAQAEYGRTGIDVKERFYKEIRQIREKEKAEKERKRRWFGGK